MFLSMIWLLMIRFFVAGMSWITVVVFNALVVSVTMFFYIKGGILLSIDTLSSMIVSHT